jgi:hypothetical protein
MAPKINKTLAHHVITVYRAMSEDSQEEENYSIYVGNLSQLVESLGISMTYYSRIFRALYDGDYAALEDRGGRDKPSTVLLLREPTVEELLALTFTNPGPILSLVKRLDSLESSLGGLHVRNALAEVEKRLEALEAKKK